jgi:hypothetical protein
MEMLMKMFDDDTNVIGDIGSILKMTKNMPVNKKESDNSRIVYNFKGIYDGEPFDNISVSGIGYEEYDVLVSTGNHDVIQGLFASTEEVVEFLNDVFSKK